MKYSLSDYILHPLSTKQERYSRSRVKWRKSNPVLNYQQPKKNRVSLSQRIINRFSDRAPDFVIGSKDDPYLMRWWVIPRNRIFNIYLHKFLRDDDDRVLHDHPWPSCSIILKGGYLEHMPNGVKKARYPGKAYFRSATAAHRIELHKDVFEVKDASGGFYKVGEKILVRRQAWTLFITGPKIREWGFHCPKGWVHWRLFCDVKEGEAMGGEIGKGCDQ
jgi:hypothetical protein